MAALRQNASLRSALAQSARMLATLPRVRAFAYLSARDPLPFVKSLVDQVPFAEHSLRWGLRRLVQPGIARAREVG